MGANATTSVPTYVAGEVLTAADLNVTNSGIPVFADSTARTNGFGGTGEKTLAEGQYAYLEDDNKTYVYDGSAWQEVANSGLVLISSTTIGSAVSSVTVSNAFSSTYQNYLILLDGGVASTNIEIQLQLGATTSGYKASHMYMTTDSNTITGSSTNTGANFPVAGYGSVNTLNARIDLFGPNAAKYTNIHFQAVRSVDAGRTAVGQGLLADTTQYTAFTLLASTGTMTGGVIRVYGYKN